MKEEQTLPLIAAKTIEQHHMLKQGDSVLLGVSGGADSVALLVFLRQIAPGLGLKLKVGHVNHCLRGEESDGDEEFVRRLAQKLGVEFVCSSFDAKTEAKKAGMGLEEYARLRRYEFFHQWAGEDGIIATAHTLDDAMETVLLNLTRGTGIRGLRGIPYVRDRIIRPLRDCTREQVEAFLMEAGQDYRTDSTNCTDIYSRNKLRHQVIPVLRQLNSGLPRAFQSLMTQMTDQWKMTEELTDRAERECTLETGRLDRQRLLELPPPVRENLWLRLLEREKVPVSSGALERLERCALQGKGAVEPRRGLRLRAASREVWLEREIPPLPPFETPWLDLPREKSLLYPVFPGRNLRLTVLPEKTGISAEKINNKDLKNQLDYDTICKAVLLRSPKPQDLLRQRGKDNGIPFLYRTGSRGLTSGAISRMLVMEDREGIIWAQGLGAADRCRVTAQTSRILYIEVLEDVE